VDGSARSVAISSLPVTLSSHRVLSGSRHTGRVELGAGRRRARGRAGGFHGTGHYPAVHWSAEL